MTRVIQASLTGGEVSTSIGARVDLAKYSTALAACLNYFVRPYGGVSTRPGFEYVSRAKYKDKAARLIEFEFNTTQAYVLEFGDLYIRVFKDGGHVLEAPLAITGTTQADPVVVTISAAHGYANGDEVYIDNIVGMTELNAEEYLAANVTATTFELTDSNGVNIDGTGFTAYTSDGTSERVYEIATPYLEADLPLIKHVQSADVMTLTHPSYEQRELSRTDHDAWALDVIVFAPEQPFPTGLSVSAVTTGAETVRYTVTAVNEENAEESLRATQATTVITGATQADPVVIAAAGHGYANGDEIYIQGVVGMTELNATAFKIANVAANTLELQGVDGTAYTAYTSGGTLAGTFFEITNGAATAKNDVSWSAAPGALTYNIYKDENGIYGFIGRTEELTFRDGNLAPDLEDTPPKARNPFVGAGNYPSTVGYFQQRRVFGNTDNATQKMWLTQAGHQYNLTVSSPSRDADAITVTIAAMRVNEIRHFVPLSDLVVLTAGGEWLTPYPDTGLTPSNISIKPQGYRGATELQPLVIGDTMIYMQPGQHVRDFSYKFESDSYTGNDVSILARHLLDAYTVDDWTYSQSPHSIIWGARSDGVLLGLTYIREQEVFGWHRHTSPYGVFESVASIPENDQDAVYALVKRTIDGDVKRYIERMHTRDFTVVEDAFCVDSGLTFDVPVAITGYTQADPIVVAATAHDLSNGDTVDIEGVLEIGGGLDDAPSLSETLNGNGFTVANITANTFELQNNGANVDGTALAAYASGGNVRKAVTVVSGLTHLNGMTIVALANGNVVKNLLVTDGSITLPNPASRIHAGLGYTAELETLRLDIGQQTGGTIQAALKKLNQIAIRVEDTRGLWIGPDRDHLREHKPRTDEGYNVATKMTTGDIVMSMSPDWNEDGSLVIRQPDPLPQTILGLIPDVTVGK